MIIKSLVRDEGMRITLDAASVGSAVGAFFGFLPDVAAVLTVIWLGLRIYEMDTVQAIFGRKAVKRDENDDSIG